MRSGPGVRSLSERVTASQLTNWTLASPSCEIKHFKARQPQICFKHGPALLMKGNLLSCKNLDCFHSGEVTREGSGTQLRSRLLSARPGLPALGKATLAQVPCHSRALGHGSVLAGKAAWYGVLRELLVVCRVRASSLLCPFWLMHPVGRWGGRPGEGRGWPHGPLVVATLQGTARMEDSWWAELDKEAV